MKEINKISVFEDGSELGTLEDRGNLNDMTLAIKLVQQIKRLNVNTGKNS